MAITPEEAQAISAEELNEVDRLEQSFDVAIRATYTPGREIYCDLPSKISERVRNELIRRYQNAGWIVKYHDDQRDGTSLGFKSDVQ